MEAERLTSWLRDGLYRELVEHILPYWMEHALDREHGGFVGRITQENRVVSDAAKGSVLNSRILWSFSAAYRVLGQSEYRQVASRAYDYLKSRFVDAEHGGVYWTLNHTGEPCDTRKHVYAQAFAIYGLSEYVRATDHEPARELAIGIYRSVERHGTDPEHGGYFEAFSREWDPLEDVRLSAKEPNTAKSMNTHLHLLEAYTNLYRVWPVSPLRRHLTALLDLFLTTIVDAGRNHLVAFFDADWSPRSRCISFGHDIEASWLLLEAADVLGDAVRRKRTREVCLDIARVTAKEGLDEDGGLFNETTTDGAVDTDKHWWPQAEAIVGFLNAYQESGDVSFLTAAAASWTFARKYIVDSRHGEWFFRVDRRGSPYGEEDKVGVWKCPYHNARVCLEVITRADELGRHK